MLRLTFIEPDGTSHVVDGDGYSTLMEAATAAGVAGILAQCGGGCSCGTCHVHIAPEWVERVGWPSTMESDMLSIASHRRPNSRLACQIRLRLQMDGLSVSVPPSQP
ncbi:MAG: ferredoxin [Sphingomonadales bacterium]|nr:ferredoxin [Sphingomonadales bacterium]